MVEHWKQQRYKIRCSETKRQWLYGSKSRQLRSLVKLSINLKIKPRSFKYHGRLKLKVERW